ncbi:L-dopachrome tautomerase-related protein [Stigmatella sp. ncwal1]|uniref:L-dopachrome tautomerase-related protein n=1 Tax=Stigmatella ashevillensis TaxID=2995309 RepID=A0ABT5DN70_9BACT|nr:L-dopachrome tautomerase-related protein [Stigmatella ashevillena]MDC0715054.1 L-dopachrome tautomerase-related protein [Stigmatella ashevillena]
MARSPRQWTGIAVSKEGRIFVNFPRWSDDVPTSVAEVKDGAIVPWPDEAWNGWTPEAGAEGRFVAVQSVVIDRKNRLWVLDTGNPGFKGVIAPPRLHQFALSGGPPVRTYVFPPEVSSGDSYLNDVSVDTERELAYLTDSQAGGLVVLELKGGGARKVLAQHPSTHAEASQLTVMGRTWQKAVQSDGIALSPDGKTLYWSVLTGHSLWRIPTEALLDATLQDEALGSRVERVHTVVAPDGIFFDRKGVLWLGGLENSSINRYVPGGTYEQVIQDDRLRWPDSLAEGPEGKIYVTTSQIYLPPAERGPYEIYRFSP